MGFSQEDEETMDDSLKWNMLSFETVRKDEWIDFRANRCELPNGKVIEPFYTYRRNNFVVVVASLPDGTYVCVKQFRPGIEKVVTEFTAGAVEAGEDPLLAAKRELLEETGYESDEWKRIMKVSPNATISDNYAYCYTAKNCRKVSGQHLDETECLETVLVPEKQLRAMIARDEFLQAVHVAAFLQGQGSGGGVRGRL